MQTEQGIVKHATPILCSYTMCPLASPTIQNKPICGAEPSSGRTCDHDMESNMSLKKINPL